MAVHDPSVPASFPQINSVSQHPRRLIVNADDFGRSHSINQAVLRAHQNGILTTASLMVNETALEEAVAIAQDNPRLGVGLHLTLACGRSALAPGQIPGLVNLQGSFSNNPVQAGMRYFFNGKLKSQLRSEMAAQFERFHKTGLRLDHVNGHLNIHLHPVIADLLMANAGDWGIGHLRLTRDPFWFNTALDSGHWLYKTSHSFIYLLLSARVRPALRRQGIRHTCRVFGLLQNARVNEAYIRRLLDKLPEGDSELYSHPSLDEFRHELDALTSPAVRQTVEKLGIQLIRYQDL